MLKQPRTQAQIEAARRNGAKSRGPKTEEGRAISSRNALKHGLRAETHIVLENESEANFHLLLENYLNTYTPANEAEHQLVLEIARCAWRLERFAAVEADLFNLEMRRNEKRLAEAYPDGLTAGEHIARAFTSMCVQTNQLQVLLRYQSAARRGLLTATAALTRMQAERNRRLARNLPNEPEPRKRPVPTPPPTHAGTPKPILCSFPSSELKVTPQSVIQGTNGTRLPPDSLTEPTNSC